VITLVVVYNQNFFAYINAHGLIVTQSAIETLN
jgi:hypothetical protein